MLAQPSHSSLPDPSSSTSSRFLCTSFQPCRSRLTQQQGLQKYFSVQDTCGDCSSQSQPHFDLWMGVPSYSNKTQLNICADGITVSDPTATVIINPNNGYYVDTTALMTGTGVCDTDADYSRTQPVLASGGTTPGNGNTGGPTTLSTVVSSAIPTTSAQSVGGLGLSETTVVGSGSCGWRHHCQGAPCENDNDCGDPFSCVNHVCT